MATKRKVAGEKQARKKYEAPKLTKHGKLRFVDTIGGAAAT